MSTAQDGCISTYIRLSRGTVEVPWESRNALIGQMLHLDSAKPIIEHSRAPV
jgi:hypothetical protein